MLAEPPTTQYDVRFRLFGIPVRVHPWFWLVAVVLGWGDGDPQTLLIWVGAVFVSILIHELGHAFCARAFGSDPHVVLYSFGGLAIYQPGRKMSAWHQIAISFCGPLAGFLFAALVWGIVHAAGGTRTWLQDVLVRDLLWINVGWGIVNLLPIWPLDGGQISDDFLGQVSPARGFSIARGLSVLCAALVVGLALWAREFYIAFLFGYLAALNLQRGGMLGGYR